MINLVKYLESLDYVKCNLCGSDGTTFVHDRERFGLKINTVICNTCGLVYLNPRPTEESYRRMYESDYRIAVFGTEVGGERQFQGEFTVADKFILPFFARHHRGKVASILDIGCSHGGLLSAFSREYPDARLYGVEPGISVAEYARERTGANIKVGNFEPRIFSEGFDLIVFTRSLNHMRDPSDLLRLARSMLNPEGVLLLSVLDAVSILMQMGLDRFTEVLHPYVFTRETIQCLVSKAGLNVIGYEDGLFDPTKLSKNKIKSRSFQGIQEMLILAKAGDGDGSDYPAASTILDRLNTNSRFYRQHRDIMFAGTNYRIIRRKLGRWKRALMSILK